MMSLILVAGRVDVVPDEPLALGQWADEELLRFYVVDKLGFELIAKRTGIPWRALIPRILPGLRAGSLPTSPPVCLTCERHVHAPRHFLRSRTADRKVVVGTSTPGRAVPVPAYCLFCCQPRSEAAIEQGKAQARLGLADNEPAREIARRVGHPA